MLRDVVAYGTATKALSLGRRDIAGKTGTTKRETSMPVRGLHATARRRRVGGHDQPKSLGAQRDGRRGGAADLDRLHAEGAEGLPDVPAEAAGRPGLAGINAESGLRDDAGSISEWFFKRSTCHGVWKRLLRRPVSGGRSSQDVRNQLF